MLTKFKRLKEQMDWLQYVIAIFVIAFMFIGIFEVVTGMKEMFF